MDSGLVAELVIGPATSGQTRWRQSGMTRERVAHSSRLRAQGRCGKDRRALNAFGAVLWRRTLALYVWRSRRAVDKAAEGPLP